MRISDTFSELKKNKEGALIAYVCAGDGDTPGIVHALVKGGADIVELGLPFSDPVADGPTIQASIQRALDAGMNPDKYFAMVRNLDVDVPLVVMTYYNLIFKRGPERFVKDCLESGITGIIVPDLPPEESGELAGYCEKNGVDLIFLVAPTTKGSRLEDILKRGTGFLYLVSRLGVTGARADIAMSTKEVLDRVRTDTPRAVGFGISSGEQAAGVFKSGADGVIVGSAFVDIIASGQDVIGRLEAMASELKSSLR
ncbi:MAG: tryptophan synthase subunit alpha [Methanosarcinales archaeon]|nr:tryptophan synthase subunit alpha [ANME-2 cluster archaeon]MDW7776124.1 tryptophan synthase subunit alpha [Methanosarcinales archaeon]